MSPFVEIGRKGSKTVNDMYKKTCMEKGSCFLPGTLFLVPTPIGHLQDITLRAIETLRSVDWIAAEDTRHSKRLLQHYGVKTPCLSLHQHNEAQRAVQLLTYLRDGKDVALISDAGTPLISDPGYRLVALLQAQSIRIVPLPGPCALVSALIASGLSTERFLFVGFLPARGHARQQAILDVKALPDTVIIYESIHRLLNLLELLVTIIGPNRRATVARELTKTYETIKTAALSELLAWVSADAKQQKGEVVVLLEGNKTVNATESTHCLTDQQILLPLLKSLPLSQAVHIAVEMTTTKRKILYAKALKLQREM